MDMTNRGLNLHRFTDFKYANGALNLSKDGVKQYTNDRTTSRKSATDHLHKTKNIKKEKMSYEFIKKQRIENPEFATGKQFRRSKGSAGKLNKKNRK